MPKLPTLSPRRRRAQLQAEADRQAFQKAAGAIGALAGKLGMTPGVAPGSSWYNGGNMQMLRSAATESLQQQFKQPTEEVEAALAAQGLSWSPPFGPGEPLHPYLGYRTPPRTRDYTVGENVQITPRFGRISFPTLKGIYGSYDVAQICVQHRVDDLRSLDISWLPAEGIKDDVTHDIAKASAFFRLPDRRHPFNTWLAMYAQDILRWDAGCLYVRRNNLNEPIALEVVDGTTMVVLTDFFGRLPMDEHDDTMSPDDLDLQGEIVPAYVQIIQGMPFEWLTADDIIYQPLNPVSESQYGLAPLEKILLSANTDIRFQWHFLNYFTEGTLPAGFMEAPPDMSNPAEIAQWQETWDDLMLGDQSKLRQIRWVPNGSKFTPAKNSDFNPEFPLYLMRRTCAAYGVTPADLGFTEDVNRATSETQVDIQFRVGTRPLIRHIEDVISLFVQRELGLKVRLQIDDGREVEDRVATAQADQIYINSGVYSSDEVRDRLGEKTDKTQPVPRVLVLRTGVTPLEQIMSTTEHDIDPETFAPKDHVAFKPPPVPPQLPPPGGKGAKPGEEPQQGEQEQGKPEQASSEAKPAAEPAEKAEYDYPVLAAAKDATAGVTAETGVQGSDIVHRDGDEDEDDEVEKAVVDLALRRWRDNSRNRLRKGRSPRPFVDPDLPAELHDLIWGALKSARSREEVDAAFEAVEGKALARKAGHFDPDEPRGLHGEWTGGALALLVPDHAPADPHGDLHPAASLDDLASRHPNVEIGALERPNGIQLTMLKVDPAKQGQGHASAAMRDLTQYADQKNKPIALTPEPVGEGMRETSLRAFYRGHGFVSNSGKQEVPGLHGTMVRHPGDAPRIPIAKAAAEDFHRNSDRIVEHYQPLIDAKLARLVPKGKLEQLARENQPVEKAVIDRPTRTGGDEDDGGIGEMLRQMLLDMLRDLVPGNVVDQLEGLLTQLYGDSALQAVYHATQAAGIGLPDWVANLQLPDDYWDNWTPGWGEAAAKVAGPGLKDLLDQAEVSIRGMVDTTLERLGDTLAEGLTAGDPVGKVAQAAVEAGANPARAGMIANTELARAMTATSMDTYQQAGVMELRWLAEASACALCQANEDASPIGIDEEWPSGSVPVHPNCRCAVIPEV